MLNKELLDQLLDQTDLKEECRITLNSDLTKENLNQQLDVIFSPIIESKMKKLSETLSTYNADKCSQLMTISIPVVFLTPIPDELFSAIDTYFKFNNDVWDKRIIVRFKCIQNKLEIKECPPIADTRSISLSPAIQECIASESTPKVNPEKERPNISAHDKKKSIDILPEIRVKYGNNKYAKFESEKFSYNSYNKADQNPKKADKNSLFRFCIFKVKSSNMKTKHVPQISVPVISVRP